MGMPNLFTPESLYVRLRFAASVPSEFSFVSAGIGEAKEEEENGLRLAPLQVKT